VTINVSLSFVLKQKKQKFKAA